RVLDRLQQHLGRLVGGAIEGTGLAERIRTVLRLVGGYVGGRRAPRNTRRVGGDVGRVSTDIRTLRGGDDRGVFLAIGPEELDVLADGEALRLHLRNERCRLWSFIGEVDPVRAERLDLLDRRGEVFLPGLGLVAHGWAVVIFQIL